MSTSRWSKHGDSITNWETAQNTSAAQERRIPEQGWKIFARLRGIWERRSRKWNEKRHSDPKIDSLIRLPRPIRGMEKVDVDLLNAWGQKNWDRVMKAQERLEQKEVPFKWNRK